MNIFQLALLYLEINLNQITLVNFILYKMCLSFQFFTNACYTCR